MSLNNISLNPRLLTQLYPNTLLETTAKDVAARQPEAEITPQQKIALPSQNIPAAQIAGAATTDVQAASTPVIAPMPAPIVKDQSVEYGNTPSLGGNKRGVLILVSNNTAPYLSNAELEFLSAILGACRLSIADVAIVNLHHYPQPYTSLLQQFGSRQVLLMGVTPQQIDLPFHFPHFQLQPFDGRTYLSAYPLAQMAQDRELKMQLWGCLKKMFGV